MRFSVLLPLIAIVILVSAETSFSQEKHGWPTMTLFAGGYSFDNSTDLDAEPLYGLKLGYEINGKDLKSRLGIEAVYHQVAGKVNDLGGDVDVTLLRVDVLYLFDPIKKAKKLIPFLSVGAGGQFVDGDLGSGSDPLLAYGFGLKFPLNSALSLRADVRHVLVFADEQLNEFEYTAGLHYTFGKPGKIRKKDQTAVDSDKDGVVDAKDQCLGTPNDLKVNRTGCPVDPPDIDLDGVPDYLDRCPDTNRGFAVDANGCLFDSDGDGVADEFDQCPNNPPGFEVNEDGCMKISN